MALTIGELGKATGTKVETIRYYERIGLMPKPDRTMGNYRAYARRDLDRLSFIRRARDLGFPLDQVRALLALADRRDQSCATVDALARTHLAEVERKIADLQALQRELSNLLSECSRGVIADCMIIEALGPVSAT
jgi:Cu(I)-responsive transcriptional regulator